MYVYTIAASAKREEGIIVLFDCDGGEERELHVYESRNGFFPFYAMPLFESVLNSYIFKFKERTSFEYLII